MSLTALPREIQDLIISDDVLTKRDYKALRLASPLFRTTFNATLFQRVRLSSARKDWAILHEMTTRPELAGLVEELVWYELVDVDAVLARRRDVGAPCVIVDDDETPIPSAEDLFLDLKKSHLLAKDPDRQRLVQEFFVAVDKMPRLNGFGTMAMPPEHVLAFTPRVVSARLFYRRLLGDEAPRHRRARLCPSPGFEALIQSVMARGTPRIKRLYYVDPPLVSRIMHRTEPGFAASVHLTDIRVCANWDFRMCRLFTHVLIGARWLQRLKICNRAGPMITSGQPQGLHVTFANFPTRIWVKLEVLQLVSIPVVDPDQAFDSPAGERFLRFLGHHDRTLRHVTLDRCWVTRQLVECIPQVLGINLNLETFRVTCKPRFGKTVFVDELELLAFVNGRTTSRDAIARVSENDFFSTFYPPGEEEISAMNGTEFSCTTTDLKLDTRTDGHRLLLDESLRRAPKYAHRKREDGVTRWKLGVADNEVYYWPSDEPDAYDTSTWLFYHRDGAMVLGDEPTDHFLEWDSEDGEDWAEDTPVGEELRQFLDARETWGEDDEIPEGAELFVSENFRDDTAEYWDHARDRLSPFELGSEDEAGEEA